jgi:hypothetical protein
MAKFVLIGVVLQFAVVTAGHFSPPVLDLSAVLGTVIPFVVGIWYGAVVPTTYKASAWGGFVVGIVGAVVGIVAAILMGDQTWMPLTYAPIASGVTGIMGAALGTLWRGSGKKA